MEAARSPIREMRTPERPLSQPGRRTPGKGLVQLPEPACARRVSRHRSCPPPRAGQPAGRAGGCVLSEPLVPKGAVVPFVWEASHLGM